MNCDLEGDLAGCAELRAFAESLRSAPQASVKDGFADRVMAAVDAAKKPRAKWHMPPLGAVLGLAASLAVAAAYFFIHSEMSSSIRKAARMELLVHCQRDDGTFSSSSAAPYMQAFAVAALANSDRTMHSAALTAAVGAIMRAQNADGGWANAAISARNVEALRVATEAGVDGAKRAYRRGLRYLRVNGIGEMTKAEFVLAAKDAVRRINVSDEGLARSAAMCAAM